MKTAIPRWVKKILRLFVQRDNYDFFIGDLEETIFYKRKSSNTVLVLFWVLFEIIKSIPGLINNKIYWGVIMFLNYLKVSIRNLFRNKGITFINIFGLSLGLTCTILIMMFILDEISFDKFHNNSENIYRVVKDHNISGGEILPVAVTPSALGAAMKEKHPEVVEATTLKYMRKTIKKDENLLSERVLFADDSFFKVFNFPLLSGSMDMVLKEKYSIVLSEKLAQKIFGDKNPVGEILNINNKYSLNVTGIFKDAPKNSHLQFEAIAPFPLVEEDGMKLNDWGSSTFYTYVVLRNGTDYTDFNKKAKNIINDNREGVDLTVYLQPMLDIHLYSGSKFAADIQGHGNIEYVKIFSLVALFVLIIACINFMNLSTARSTKRAKEVSLRKVVGGVRSQIVWQFFVESIFLSFVSLFVAMIFIYLLLPEFNMLSGKDFNFWEMDSTIIISVVAIGLFTGIISGSYPALFLSSFLPAKVLKGSFSTSKAGSFLRKGLVITQFSLAVILLLGTIIVYSQLDYIQNKNLGFTKENIVKVNIDDPVKNKIDVVKQSLEKNPGIISTTLSNDIPLRYSGYGSSSLGWEGKNPDENIMMNFAMVDEDYIKTFDMKLTEGRFFSKDFAADSASVVINETALEIMNYKNPIGKQMSMWGDELTIIGILKDINYNKLDSKSGPLILRYMSDWNHDLFVRISPQNVTATLSFIEATLKQMGTQQPFRFEFLDDEINEFYQSEQRMGQLFSYFSVLIIIISCMGLFALASFMAERRRKEIGIRKVLGASVFKLTGLLSKEFAILVLVSNLIASPLAYYFMNSWLSDFVYRIDISFYIFPLVAFTTLLIALATVAYQALKAALSNPVKALKYE